MELEMQSMMKQKREQILSRNGDVPIAFSIQDWSELIEHAKLSFLNICMRFPFELEGQLGWKVSRLQYE